MAEPTQQKPAAFLRWPDVQARVGLSRSHAHFLASQGHFPRPCKLGPRASGWLESDIDQWIAERKAAAE